MLDGKRIYAIVLFDMVHYVRALRRSMAKGGTVELDDFAHPYISFFIRFLFCFLYAIFNIDPILWSFRQYFSRKAIYTLADFAVLWLVS